MHTTTGGTVSTHALRDSIIEFYRKELRRRYQLSNVRRFSQFDNIPDTQVEALRNYFLDQIYPPPEQRERLDRAFEHLASVLHSPRRVRPLMSAALRSAWRMGHRFPSAVAAGLATIDAYRETHVLEACMMKNAEALGVTAADSRKRARMIHLIAAVPESDVLRLIRDILRLFHALSNIRMLETAIQFMEVCRDVTEQRPDLYSTEDHDGFTLGVEVVRGGLDLFQHVDPDEFPNIIAGIEAVELEWFERVRTEALA